VPIRRIQQPGWYRGETVVGTRAEEILEAGSSTDNALAAVTNSTTIVPRPDYRAALEIQRYIIMALFDMVVLHLL
jgi:hypothetical protein